MVIELYTYPVGFIFTFFSILSLFRLKISLTIKFGIVGNILYCLSILTSIPMMYYFTRDTPLLLLLLSRISLLIINLIYLHKLRLKKREITLEDESEIRKTILNLGTKFMRLEVREISEKCGFDRDSIIGVLKKMIINEEIYADFFQTTNTVSFDQQTNIDEIDRLMTVYKDWEKDHYEKET
ncbi:hypothetical protein LCGC14_1181210 [marine sediment metagenome]|uniref:PCI domain-containing protein n=1 Tax=marine sediment metagenome TaxID=412755 RepID=A0A0F9LRV6_9ZZZZ